MNNPTFPPQLPPRSFFLYVFSSAIIRFKEGLGLLFFLFRDLLAPHQESVERVPLTSPPFPKVGWPQQFFYSPPTSTLFGFDARFFPKYLLILSVSRSLPFPHGGLHFLVLICGVTFFLPLCPFQNG